MDAQEAERVTRLSDIELRQRVQDMPVDGRALTPATVVFERRPVRIIRRNQVDRFESQGPDLGALGQGPLPSMHGRQLDFGPRDVLGRAFDEGQQPGGIRYIEIWTLK